MKFLALSLTIAFFLAAPQSAHSVSKIISGTAPSAEHPGTYNTVALVKTEDGKIFCTGSLIGSNLIATAKHCLVDKTLGDFKIYFGDDTTKPEENLYREVTRFKVRYPVDWSMMFPSFDVAWVEFKGEMPRGFKTLPILSDGDFLRVSQDIHQVGFGNNSPQRGVIRAGQKLLGKTRLESYINNARFFHILVFKGDEGQGSCHGDSGGPAYAQVEGEWFIVGVTNGFDLVLTPESMQRTGDEDFPFDVDCSKNHSLYSFLGAHGDWIEETSQRKIEKSDEFISADRVETKTYSSLNQWCEATDIGSPNWNLLKVLLDKHVDKIDQNEAKDFYNNCNAIVQYLSAIEEISLDSSTTMEGSLSFQSLNLLPNLKSLRLSNFPKGILDLKSIKSLKLDKLVLMNLEIRSLDELSANTVRELSLAKNPMINSLKGIKKFIGLEELNISSTSIKTLQPLKGMGIKQLHASSINAAYLLELNSLSSQLESLDIRNTVIPSSEAIFKRFKGLKELWLTGDSKQVDLSSNVNIEFLTLNGFKFGEIIFPKTLNKLRQISASNCDLESLSFLASANSMKKASLTFNRVSDLSVFADHAFPNLTDLNLSVNPILDLSPLKSLSKLRILRVGRTPIQSKLIPKTEENCPTINSPEVLAKFCSK